MLNPDMLLRRVVILHILSWPDRKSGILAGVDFEN